jgi:hypothetical protein
MIAGMELKLPGAAAAAGKQVPAQFRSAAMVKSPDGTPLRLS